ncbi:MAG: T9SS type A sorting domain-containing protein, partial [Candidatus Marinimicrobia bacterium]|nr:T9SS type A sorting domain-containing protein [Candidatus Neomarinimicrobiota bacterium]
NPMTIMITEATVNGLALENGDEIALFDGERCVGSSIISGEIEAGNFWVTASQDDGENNGFAEGNPISLKVWDSSENSEYETMQIVWLNEWAEATDVPAFDGLGTAFASINAVNLPDDYALAQNYPNPFNPSTAIQFALPEDAQARIVIYDLQGREVAELLNDNLSAGYHEVKWNGLNSLNQSVASGIYFYELQTAAFHQVKKMVLMR